MSAGMAERQISAAPWVGSHVVRVSCSSWRALVLGLQTRPLPPLLGSWPVLSGEDTEIEKSPPDIMDHHTRLLQSFLNIKPVAKFSLVPCFLVVLSWARKGCAVLEVGFPWGNEGDSTQVKWLVFLCSQWGERSVSRMCYLLVPSATGV